MDSHSASGVDFSAQDYVSYNRLIHKLARKFNKQLAERGISEEYEDTFQNVAISFIQAKMTFRNDGGAKFSTYATVASTNNHINDMNRKMMERLQCACSLEEISQFEDGAWEDIVADEETVEFNIPPSLKFEEIKEKINGLSLMAKLVIRELVSPSDEIKQAHRAKLAYAEQCRLAGERVPRISEEIDYRFIFQHYKIDSKAKHRVIQELQREFGI